MDDHRQDREILELKQKLEREHQRSSESREAIRDSFQVLEEALGRSLLLLHALTEVCVRKNLLTREEIRTVADELDHLDGVSDGKMDPESTIPAEKQRSPSVYETLRKLENQQLVSPSDFLRNLSDSENGGRL